MTVKLGDVKGLMVNKEIRHLESPSNFNFGFNSAIDLMAQRSITLNREKLATLFYNRKMKNYPIPNDEDILEATAFSYREADAILASLPELVECAEDLK